MSAPIQAKVFECAAQIAGGRARLCERLEISPVQLARWIANEETCPLPAFLGAVDVIMESERGFAAIFDSPHRRPALAAVRGQHSCDK